MENLHGTHMASMDNVDWDCRGNFRRTLEGPSAMWGKNLGLH